MAPRKKGQERQEAKGPLVTESARACSYYSRMMMVDSPPHQPKKKQLLFKFAGTVTAVLNFWLDNFGWTHVAAPVYRRVL